MKANLLPRKIPLSIMINLTMMILFIFLALAQDQHHSTTSLDYPAVVRIYVKDHEHLNAVAGRLDIWEVHRAEKYVVVRVKPTQYSWLQSLGYKLEIDHEKTSLLKRKAILDPRYFYFDDYFNNTNDRFIVNFLQTINTKYPALTELIDIGDAWMAGRVGEHHRDMLVLRVTNEDTIYGPIESKPVFFLFATIHAREVVVPELAIRYILYLTEGYAGEGGYGLDPDVTWLVNHNVAYILVMQNPDGHWVNEEDTRNYRRKNMDWDDGCNQSDWSGVDLNRNHSFFWGCCGGSSGDPCDPTYRGPTRNSEPETQAFQNYFAAVMYDQNGPNGNDEIPLAAPDSATGIFISLHSYGNLILWPFGFDTYGPAPNDAQLEMIGRKFAAYNDYDPCGSIWYDIDGDSGDWVYGMFGIASFTLEVGPDDYSYCSDFFPEYGCIDGIDGMTRNFWMENKPVFLYAHKIARTPYKTACGPDTENVTVLSDPFGETLLLSAQITDNRYRTDPRRPIAAAEYFIDFPGQDGLGSALSPDDGNWDSVSESVKTIVPISDLTQGLHYILVHGQNDNGDWGPLSGAFFYVHNPGHIIHKFK
ncbi:M14 family zinc carboxypeptidase [candidate division CSSED10-310 bacterium]|uniref:M14 family zinc carboxypeptidase n=1 Tax=candidate division CSSED10-310 bacterium TaxID=2855610 RepID=A0ABV6YUA3_UNCC1